MIHVNDNGAGSVICRTEHQYALYDALPAAVRQVLQDAPFDYDVADIAEMWAQAEADDWTAGEFARALENAFAAEAEREAGR